jgi:hypothetical protein
MQEFLFQRQWKWLPSGILLGTIFMLTVLLVKPIGVSTQFVILDGIIGDTINPNLVVEDPKAKSGYVSTNEYLNKSGGKYAKNVENPINYSFVFVLAMIAGGLVASKMSTDRPSKEELKVPSIWKNSFGPSETKRYAAAFLGGIFVLIGARLAGGCTSGHMMSGMMQTSLSGYIFAAGVFMVAIPLAFLLYKKEK